MATRAAPDVTIHAFMQFTRETCPSSAASVERWLARATPAIAARFTPHVVPPGEVDAPTTWEAFYQQVPARHICDAFDWSQRGKTPYLAWIVEAVPDLARVQAFAKDYRRAVVRAMNAAFARHFISRAHTGVAAPWIEALQPLVDELPSTHPKLANWASSKGDDFLGLSIAAVPDRVKKLAAEVRDTTNVLARHLTALGVDTPEAVTPEMLHGNEASFYAAMLAANPAYSIRVTRARQGWNFLRERNPNLVPWPAPREERNYGIKRDACDPLCRDMLDQIEAALASKSPETRRNTLWFMQRLIGFHMNRRKRDLSPLWDKTYRPEDVGWLLLGGRKAAGRELATEIQIERVLSDPHHREQLLEELPELHQAHQTAYGLRANPFIDDAVNDLMARGHADSAEHLAKVAKSVAVEWLGADPDQMRWLGKLRTAAKKAKKRQPPTKQARRKNALGDMSDLWARLMADRGLVSAHTAEQRRVMEEKPTRRRKLDWAIAVRDEMVFLLVLAFQLRPSNLEELIINETVFPERHVIDIPDNQAKAFSGVKKDFSTGYIPELKPIFEEYWYVARDLLLDGRSTPYFMVAERRGREVFDADGRLTVADTFADQILAKIIRRHFQHLLPDGVKTLPPGEMRHVVSRYFYDHGASEAMESNHLGHTPNTARIHYQRHGRRNDAASRQFVHEVATNAAKVRKVDRAKAHNAMVEDIRKALPPDVDPVVLAGILRSVGTYLKQVRA